MLKILQVSRSSCSCLDHVCSAAGLKLVAYYHNEAQSGKDVCDTHFSHQQTHVDAYLVQGDGGRKVSTPKQLAVALMTNSVCNTTVLLVKPDFSAAYRTAVIPAVPGKSMQPSTSQIIMVSRKSSFSAVLVTMCHHSLFLFLCAMPVL